MVSPVSFRDPVFTARMGYQIDDLSGGRLSLGVGAGWNAEEMEHHGVAYADRWKVLRERVLAMVAHIGTATATNLIFTTHHADERPPCMTHELQLAKDGEWAIRRLLERD